MNCCSNVPPEAAVQDVSVSVLEVKPVSEDSPQISLAEAIRIAVESRLTRGSPVEVNVRQGARIFDGTGLKERTLVAPTQFVGMVTRIDETTIYLTSGWQGSYVFSGHEYKGGPMGIGCIEINKEDISEIYDLR